MCWRIAFLNKRLFAQALVRRRLMQTKSCRSSSCEPATIGNAASCVSAKRTRSSGNRRRSEMKRRDFIATLMLSTLVGFVPAKAADPSKIKVGILLPLTGPFAAVAETQKQGALLAVDVINKRGGLHMPWGKVTVEGVVDDDEAKLDVGVRQQ